MTKTSAFLEELNELSIKHGIGITGSPELFLLEREDVASLEHPGNEDRLIFCHNGDGHSP